MIAFELLLLLHRNFDFNNHHLQCSHKNFVRSRDALRHATHQRDSHALFTSHSNTTPLNQNVGNKGKKYGKSRYRAMITLYYIHE
jgi:hypothetical protein